VLFQHRIVAPGHDGVEVQVEDRFAGGGQPGEQAAGSVSRSSTWDTRRVPVSFSASSDSSHDTAGMTEVPGPEVTQQAGHAGAGIASPRAGLLDGQVLGEVGAQRLIPALVRVPRGGEVLRAGGRFRCHQPGLPEPLCERPHNRDRHVGPLSAVSSLSAGPELDDQVDTSHVTSS